MSSRHHDGANCLFFDGAVYFLHDDISKDLLRCLLTSAGGEDTAPSID
ncbi:MAG: H-X9-DG-CTERM domain-containing protein [Pirellulales bacterium]